MFNYSQFAFIRFTVFFSISLSILFFQNCSNNYKASELESLQSITDTSGSGNFLSAPDIVLITKPEPVVNTAAVNFIFDLMMKGGFLKSLTCQVNSQAVTNCISKQLSLTNLVDGDYSVKIMAELTSGLKSEVITSFRKDATVPTVSVQMVPATITGLNSASILFTAVDNLSGVKETHCSLDNAAFGKCVSPINYSSLAVGSHTFKMKAIDLASNESTIYSYTWTIDLAAPTVTISAKPAVVVNMTTAQFSFSSSKANSTYECKLNAAAFAVCTSPVNYSGLANQSHSFSVRAKDATGNYSAAAVYAWTVDSVAPLAPVVIADVLSTTQARTVTVNFSSNDVLSGIDFYQCSQDNLTYSACKSPLVLSNLADGNYSVKVRAFDKAGNISAISSFDFAVDNVMPNLAFTQTPVDSTLLTASFLFTYSDDRSGIDSIQCSLDNGSFANCSSPSSLANLSATAHSYRVQVKDKAGNSKIISHNWVISSGTVVDDLAVGKTLYSINCAACHGDISNSTKLGKTSAEITNAINVVSRMSGLSKLTQLERDQIAKALFVGTTSPMVVVPVILSSGFGKAKILRLSNFEYKNSIRDALSYQFSRQSSAATADTVIALDVVKGAFAALPSDISSKRFGTDQLASDQMSSDRFTAFISLASTIADATTANPTTLKAFVGACAASNLDISNTTCLDNFIKNFGGLLFRTPPKAIEITELKVGIQSWSNLVGRILIHPRFLTHIEREGTKNNDGSYQLTAYEIEARLAAMLWKSIPDIQGQNAAGSGSVLTPAGLKAEVDRMLASTKSQDTLWEFYQQWLGSNRIPGTFDSGAGFTAFASPISMAALNAVGFKDAVLQDGKDFLNYITWQSKGKLDDLFKSPLVFTMNSTLASIYGVTARSSSAQAPINVAGGRYNGILSRAIVTQQKPGRYGVGNHIQRGVLLMSNLLGTELGLPANFAEQSQLESQITDLTSSVDEARIKTSLTSCMACHSSINPSGFALAKYDSLGRYSDTEKKYKVVANVASLTTQNQIAVSSILNIDGKDYSIASLSDFVAALIDSGKLYQGFSKYYFRFALNRLEDGNLDKNMLENLNYNLKYDSIQNSLKNMILHPDFMKARPL